MIVGVDFGAPQRARDQRRKIIAIAARATGWNRYRIDATGMSLRTIEARRLTAWSRVRAMRISFLLSLSLVVAACGGSDRPDPSTPAPDPTAEEPTDQPTMMTNEECASAGGTVVGDIGDGSVQCAAGMVEIGSVSGGVEQQLCCQPTPDQ